MAGLVRESQASNYHLHHELPYRSYNDETGVFENHKSRGFGLSLSVLGGANDDLVTSLNAIVCNLPEGNEWDYQLVLVGNNQVADLIEKNTETMGVRGGVCGQFATNQGIYARHSARQGFSTQLNKAYHYDLKDYNACMFVSTTEPCDKLIEVRDMLGAELIQCGINHTPVAPAELMTHVREHLNFNRYQDRPTPTNYNEFEPIHTQTLSADSEFLLHRTYMDSRHTPTDEEKPVHTRIVNLGLARLPSDFRLYGFSSCIASLRRTSNSLQCPHRISVNFRVEHTGQQITANDGKIQSLVKTVGSPMRLLIPTAEEELEERKALQRELAHGEYKIATMVMTVSLYTTPEKARTHTTVAISTFREAGLSLIRTNMLQGQSTLCTLPFAMSEGYFEDCRKAARARTMKTSNVVNFLPLVADYKNFSGGVLVPTMRHQISYFDPFNCGSDNYNIALTGGSGAGKSFFVQQLAQAIYARFGKVWILDKGSSYKKLTQTLGGVYMTHESIFLNPFTHLGKIEAVRDAGTFGDILDDDGSKVDPIAEVLGNITALIGSMASPREPLVPFQESMLGDAILMAWERKRTDTRIDDVQAALYELAEEKEKDRRISDIAAQLNKYCSTGSTATYSTSVTARPGHPHHHPGARRVPGLGTAPGDLCFDGSHQPADVPVGQPLDPQDVHHRGGLVADERGQRADPGVHQHRLPHSAQVRRQLLYRDPGYRGLLPERGVAGRVQQLRHPHYPAPGRGVREVPQGQPETLQPVRADHDQELSASPGRRTLLRHDQGWFLHLLPPYLRRPMVAGDALHRAEGIRILRKPDATRYTADGGYRADRHALQRPRNGRVCRHPGPLPT